MSLGAGFGGGTGDKSLRLSLVDTFRLAWADPDLRRRLSFVLGVFAVFAIAVHIPVPVPGVTPGQLQDIIQGNAFLGLLNMFGGRALQRISVVALGLTPYITASIVMQILMAANPAWKQEMREGGEHAKKQQNQRTRILTIILCIGQGIGLTRLLITSGVAMTPFVQSTVILFWTAGAMLLLWLGEQVTERGVGNGVSMLIFAGIVIAFPGMLAQIYEGVRNGTVSVPQLLFVIALFIASTVLIVFFTIAQRRIPIQHMRRNMGTKAMGGQTSYLPLSLNLVGVMPIIFASSLTYLPSQIRGFFPPNSPTAGFFENIEKFFVPNLTRPEGWVGALIYTGMIFFFTYFWTAIQFNTDDMADNLKRGGSFIPGVRPGKQTKDFLNGVLTRIAVVGALFLALVAVSQYFIPLVISVTTVSLLFGTSLLIMVSVALETMRQLESNLLMKQYGG